MLHVHASLDSLFLWIVIQLDSDCYADDCGHDTLYKVGDEGCNQVAPWIPGVFACPEVQAVNDDGSKNYLEQLKNHKPHLFLQLRRPRQLTVEISGQVYNGDNAHKHHQIDKKLDARV